MKIILTILLFLLCMILMMVGVLFKRKPIEGSCGGIEALGLKKVCDCKQSCKKKQ